MTAASSQTLSPTKTGKRIITLGTAVIFATFWQKRFKRGPLEWIMRRITQ